MFIFGYGPLYALFESHSRTIGIILLLGFLSMFLLGYLFDRLELMYRKAKVKWLLSRMEAL